MKIDVDGSQGEIAARKMVPQVHAGKISWRTAAQREPQGLRGVKRRRNLVLV